MRKTVLLPAVAVAGGIAGLVIRQFYLASAFEPVTGLPVSGAPAAYAMWAITLLVFAAVIALSLGRHRTFDRCYTRAFGTSSLPLRAGCLAGAVLLLLAGIFNIAAEPTAPVILTPLARIASILRPVLGAFCLAAAAGIWFVMQKMGSGKPVQSVWPQLPGFACCFWIIANYQGWAQDPALPRYLFVLAATLLSMAACLLLAGFAYEKGRVTAALIVSLLAVTLNIMVLGDGLALGDLAIHLAMVFYLLSMSCTLLVNDAKPEPPAAPVTCGGSCQGCPGCGGTPGNNT